MCFVAPFLNWRFRVIEKKDIATGAVPLADLSANCESPIWDIVGREKKFLTDWDRFRLAAFDTAQALRKDYGFNLTDVQVYDGLQKTFFAECKFKGSAANPISSAKGIIQFMKSTRKRLDIPHDIDKLPEIKQLHYVSLYYRDCIKRHKIDGRKIDSFIDLYMVVFAPSCTTAPDWKTVYTSCLHRHKGCGYFKRPNGKRMNRGRRCAYHSNLGYDTDGDGRITKAEIRDRILNKHYRNK